MNRMELREVELVVVGGGGLSIGVGGSLPVIDAGIETVDAAAVGQDADERHEIRPLQAVLVQILRRPIAIYQFIIHSIHSIHSNLVWNCYLVATTTTPRANSSVKSRFNTMASPISVTYSIQFIFIFNSIQMTIPMDFNDTFL